MASKPLTQPKDSTHIQDTINELFWYFLRLAATCDSIAILKFIALAHRVADGTLVDYLRLHPGGERDVFNFLPTTRDQDISHVAFDASKDVIDDTNETIVSALYCWAFLPEGTSKDIMNTMFDLLQRSGGVSLHGAVQMSGGNNAYAMALVSREPFWADRLLARPELNPGWNVPCNSTISGEANPIVPLLFGLNRSLLPDATMAQIVPRTNDDSINSYIPVSSFRLTALNYAIISYPQPISYPETLYALLLRPHLDMNPPKSHQSVRESIHGTLTLNQQMAVAQVFDRAQLAFASLPAIINDILYNTYALELSLPLCNIIAQYYRMPYPILSKKAQLWAKDNPTIHPLLVPLQGDE